MDITVISTYRCDSKCSMCNVWQNPTHPDDEISLATLDKLPNNIDNLNISGGEPTLRRDLADMVDVLYPKAHKLEISSNGMHVERLEPIVRKHPNIKVRFSLEGFACTNRRIRGEDEGYNRKVSGLRRLKELGATDLGLATVIQDANAGEIVALFQLAQNLGVEYATSTLHNAFQFHKNDNQIQDQLRVAGAIESLIVAMLRTSSVKNWFRAYLNLGLIARVMGNDRLTRCTAASDCVFVDPWSDCYACNVRPDLLLGNLERQDWHDIIEGQTANRIRARVAACSQNCWMVTTARTAMRLSRLPFLPKAQPLMWVLINKLRVMMGQSIDFAHYIDYIGLRTRDTHIPHIQHGSEVQRVKRKLQRKGDPHYTVVGDYSNR